MSELADLVRVIAQALVGDPHSVRVHEHARDGETVMEVVVDEGDRGRVIGRHGSTASALRTVLAAAAARRGVRCRLEIAE